MKYFFKYLVLAALAVSPPLIAAGVISQSEAAISLQTTNVCTPDRILDCVNQVINGINTQAPTCTAAGCASPIIGAPPVITLGCSTAGGGTSSMGAGSNNFQGRVTCTSTANTIGTLTWATARAAQPTCTITGETTPVLTFVTNGMTALQWTYASTVSPVFDYICVGQ